MDEQTIMREASAALDDLELDSKVSSVSRNGDNWCVHFESEYGQFCDEFRNQFGHDNSARVVREKVKKHLLGQVAQLRNKGRRRSGRAGAESADDAPNAVELLQEAFTQTTRAIGEAIDRTLGVTRAGVETATDLTQTLTARTTEMLEPVRGRASARSLSTAKREKPKSAPKQLKAGAKAGTKKKVASKPQNKTASKRAKAGRTKKAGKKKSSRSR